MTISASPHQGAALQADVLVTRDGVYRRAVAVENGRVEFGADSGEMASLSPEQSYFVEGIPVEIHCHSIGDVDFSDFATLDLIALNRTAAEEGAACVPTVYLRHDRLDQFVAFMRRFHELRQRGLLPFVPGIALEGPLLASHGGTPASTVWPPTKHEWELLAGCGKLGLVYMVMSPDAYTTNSDLYDRLSREHPSLEWIVDMLVTSGVRPALGHYTKADATASAELTCEIVDTAWRCETPLTGARVVTDHLFNDMPLPIKHAFRTRRARAQRESLLKSYDLPSWNLADLPEQVGPVAAAIMRLCAEQKVASCINFDGEHVDLAIASRAIEVIGTGNVMLMTDRCDAARLGGQVLYPGKENTLWHQEGGIVAAGSQPIDRQIRNARGIGVDDVRVWDLVSFTAYDALGLDQDPWLGTTKAGCFVSHETYPGGATISRRVATFTGAAEISPLPKS